MKKPKRRYPSLFNYLMTPYERTFTGNGLNGMKIELGNYKGHIVLRVVDDSKKARALAKHAGLVLGGTAWLHGDDLDAFIKLMQEAKRHWLAEYKKVRIIQACAACRKVFGGVCPKHVAKKAKTRSR